jgi:predicted transcriptional regulator
MVKFTLDEKFLLKTYLLAKKSGSPDGEVKIDQIIKEAALSERQAANILKLLFFSGFIKKREEGFISLTAKGINLVEDYTTRG